RQRPKPAAPRAAGRANRRKLQQNRGIGETIHVTIAGVFRPARNQAETRPSYDGDTNEGSVGMRKLAGAVSAVAFMAAAAAIWSGLATTAAGRVTAPDVGTPPRLAPSTANNQPLPADFIRQPAAAERATKVGFRAEMGSAGTCSWQQWPFMGSDCFVSMTKPSRETNALSTPGPRVDAPAAPVAAPAPIAAAAPPVAAPTAAASATPRAAAVAPAPQPAPVAKPAPVAPVVAATAPVTPAVTRAP